MSSHSTRIASRRYAPTASGAAFRLSAVAARRLLTIPVTKVATALYWLSFVGILVLGAWLRWRGLTSISVYDEEGITVRRQLDYYLTNLYPEYISHRTFHYMSTHYVIQWLGLSELSLRLIPAVLGILGPPAAFLAVRRISGSRMVAVMAAVLVAMSVMHLHHSQFARFYPGVMFFSLLAMVSIYGAVETGQKRYWIAFVLATTLNLYNHLFAGFVLFSSGVWAGAVILLAVVRPDQSTARREALRKLGWLIGSGVAIVLLYLPALAQMASDDEMLNRLYIGKWLGGSNASSSPDAASESTELILKADQVKGFHFWVEVNRTIHDFAPKTDPKPWVFLVLGIVGLACLVLARRWRLVSFVLLSLTSPFVLLEAINSGHFFNPYYVIFLLPLYLMCVALGLERIGMLVARAVTLLRPRARIGVSMLGALASVAIFIPVLWSTIPEVKGYYRDTFLLDPRGAAKFIHENARRGDAVAMVENTHYAGFAFYDALLQGKTYDGSNRPLKLSSVNDGRRLLDRFGRLWIVADRRALLLTDPELYQWVIRDSVLVQFNGFPVYLKTRRNELLSLDDRIAMMRRADQASHGTHNVDIPLRLGDLYRARGDWDQALQSYEAAARAQPWNLLPWRKMADLVTLRGDWTQAASLYARMADQWSTDPANFVLLGDAYQQLGDPDRAFDAYAKAGRASGSDAVCLAALANYYVRIGETDNAIAAFQAALAENPHDRFAHIGLANAYWTVGDVARAQDAFQQAVVMDDGDPNSLLELARIALKMERHDDAAQLAGEAIHLSWNQILGTQEGYRHRQRERAPSTVVSGYLVLGDIASAQARWADAETFYQNAGSYAPYEARPLLRLGLLRMKTREPEAALTFYLRAASLEPTSVDANARLAAWYQQYGEIELAATRYRLLASLNPNNPHYRLEQAEMFQQAGRVLEAERIYEQLIERGEQLGMQPSLARVSGSPTILASLSVFARAYARLGDIARDNAIETSASLEGAKRLYERGLEFDAEEPALYEGLSYLYLANRRLDLAIAAYEIYASKAPKSPEIQVELGLFYRRDGRITDSEAAYRQAIAMDPSSYNAYVQLGNLLAASGKSEAASDLYRQALVVQPANVGAFKRLGDLSLQASEISDALSFYQAAIAKDPKHAPSYVAIGDLYRASGDVLRAREWYGRALQIKPDERYIQRRIEDLE